MKYQVQLIDVWGNAEDGWDCNDFRSVGEIELKSLETDSIVDRMIESGFFTSKAKCAVKIDDVSESHVMLCDSENDRPLFQLVRVDD